MANVKVKIIGLLDMLKFKNQKKTREKMIAKAKPNEIEGEWAINNNAKLLHPEYINVEVTKIVNHKKGNAKTYILGKANKLPLPYFRAGQYISLKLNIDKSFITRAYSISSGPKWALEGKYAITIKENSDGFAAPYIFKYFRVGTKLKISAPLGEFYYQKYRDEKNIVALAGGSGITPFLSMAYAIKDGVEDFNLTIIYGSKKEDEIVLKEELDKLCRATDKVKVIYVLSEEKSKKGYEHGFITSELINKYAPSSQYSIYICGPGAMYNFLDKELKKLNIPNRLIRKESFTNRIDVTTLEGYPGNSINKTHSLTIKQGPNVYKIPGVYNEPILVAIEKAGIIAPSRCRSGECGWCRSRVTSGTYFIAGNDTRRYADKKYNQIHPCITYPTSDMVIELPGEYID